MAQNHEIIGRIGKIIREREEQADEPLPERWVELIHYLNEKERRERSNKGSATRQAHAVAGGH